MADDARRHGAGVLAFFERHQSLVVLGCLLTLAGVVVLDIVTPNVDNVSSLYLVPAALGAALLRCWRSVLVGITALSAQVVTSLLERTENGATMVGAAATLIVVFAIVCALAAAKRQHVRRHHSPVLELTISENGDGLTKREREVALLVAEGLSAKDIGGRLGIGRRTVETHIARAYAKLGVESRVDLILKHIRRAGEASGF